MLLVMVTLMVYFENLCFLTEMKGLDIFEMLFEKISSSVSLLKTKIRKQNVASTFFFFSVLQSRYCFCKILFFILYNLFVCVAMAWLRIEFVANYVNLGSHLCKSTVLQKGELHIPITFHML